MLLVMDDDKLIEEDLLDIEDDREELSSSLTFSPGLYIRSCINLNLMSSSFLLKLIFGIGASSSSSSISSCIWLGLMISFSFLLTMSVEFSSSRLKYMSDNFETLRLIFSSIDRVLEFFAFLENIFTSGDVTSEDLICSFSNF